MILILGVRKAIQLDRGSVIQDVIFDKTIMSRAGYEALLHTFIEACVEFGNYKYLALLKDVPLSAKEHLRLLTSSNGFSMEHVPILKSLFASTGTQTSALTIHKSLLEEGLPILLDAIHTNPPHL